MKSQLSRFTFVGILTFACVILVGVFASPSIASTNKEDALTAAKIAKQFLTYGSFGEADPKLDRTACTFIGVAYYAIQGDKLLDDAFDFCNIMTGPEPTRAEALVSLDAFIKNH